MVGVGQGGTTYDICVEVRGQITGIGSFFPSCGAWGWNLGPQAWQQASLPMEPPHMSPTDFNSNKVQCCKFAPFHT